MAFRDILRQKFDKSPNFWGESISLVTKACHVHTEQDLLYFALAFDPAQLPPRPWGRTYAVEHPTEEECDEEIRKKGDAQTYADAWIAAWKEKGQPEIGGLCNLVQRMMNGLCNREPLCLLAESLNIYIKRYSRHRHILTLEVRQAPEHFRDWFTTADFFVNPVHEFEELGSSIVEEMRLVLLSNSMNSVGRCDLCQHPFVRRAERSYHTYCSHKCGDLASTRKRRSAQKNLSA